MFISLNLKGPEPKNVRARCACGVERSMPEQNTCPACGKILLQAVSLDDGPWVPYQQFKITQMRRALDSEAWNQVPAEHRDLIRRNVEGQIRKLEDGTWVREARQRLGLLQNMLSPDGLAKMPAEERNTMRGHLELQLQRLREELEAAGEPAVPISLIADIRHDGPRPRISRNEWERDPMSAANKVAMAVALHVPADTWTQPQRTVLYSYFYVQSIQNSGGHGELFFNWASNEDGASFESTLEALRATCTTAHVAIFEKALERWRSKPRSYTHGNIEDKEQHAAWVKESFEPVCAEFRDLDDETLRLRPPIKACLADYLRSHQEELAEVE